jgi:hypothetical protein
MHQSYASFDVLMLYSHDVDIILLPPYDVSMRTTITIEDSLYDELREIAQAKQIALKTAVNLAIASGIRALEQGKQTAGFVQKTYAMGMHRSEYDLVKALETAGDLEVAEIAHKLELRK